MHVSLQTEQRLHHWPLPNREQELSGLVSKAMRRAQRQLRGLSHRSTPGRGDEETGYVVLITGMSLTQSNENSEEVAICHIHKIEQTVHTIVTITTIYAT